MEMEERIKVLTEEIETAKEDLQEILLDIRAYILEAQNPMKYSIRKDVGILEDQEITKVQIDSEKGVQENGG